MFLCFVITYQVLRNSISNFNHCISSLKLQSFSYFETLWCFTKFSFHQKWNDAGLLLINMVYTRLKVCQYWQKALEKQKLNFSRRALFHMKTRVSLKYFVNDCSFKSYLFLNVCIILVRWIKEGKFYFHSFTAKHR